MLNLSRYANKQPARDYDELSDRQILDSSEKIRLPRHISSLESTQHNRAVNTSEYRVDRQCALNYDDCSRKTNNLAVNILQYQLQDSAAQQKHLENQRNSLQRRLETAQTKENSQLVTMLQKELRQLEPSK
jgi:anion-transporting  ArsA/GET3 family ATPase